MVTINEDKAITISFFNEPRKKNCIIFNALAPDMLLFFSSQLFAESCSGVNDCAAYVTAFRSSVSFWKMRTVCATLRSIMYIRNIRFHFGFAMSFVAKCMCKVQALLQASFLLS